jgi:two-component system NtrC family sensor kinase
MYAPSSEGTLLLLRGPERPPPVPMDTQPKQVVPDAELEEVHKGVQAIAGLGPIVFNVALIAWFWGQWTQVFGLVAVAAVLSVANLLLLEWVARRHGRVVSETARTLINVVGMVAAGVISHWHALVWIFVPFNMLWFQGLDRWGRPRMALYLALVGVGALATGADPGMTLAFTLFGICGYLLSEKRVSLLSGALGQVVAQREELEKAHRELQQLHQRAVERDKLSSLGMLAAGVAHEINNPMSFVTSNVNSMLRDLREEPNLSELMKEYVEDVLPATLDGIKRVNSIVADLRRFARGDPEAQTGYELDVEVETALRIAHGQLGHVRVEKELGVKGILVGRPRQIVQVLVNLLVNAGQATAPGGLVRVTTRRDANVVYLSVRDTGTGMSEATRQRLFEPFFTTKPAGEGTGLGLSVVHGIIKSHGGLIEVESELGQGTCFTIRLPLVPPIPHFESPTDAARRRPA